MASIGEPVRTRDVDWNNEVHRILGLMTGNNQVFIDALRRESFYPSMDAPVLNQHGGIITPGFQIELQNPNSTGTLYYTVDGSDPRDGP